MERKGTTLDDVDVEHYRGVESEVGRYLAVYALAQAKEEVK